MPTSATMSSASTVYYGPDSSNYASVGSVGLNKSVQVYAMEKNWFFIEYSTGTTTKKRGYVPYSKINNAAAVAGSVPTRSFTGYADVSGQNLTVCTGPGTSAVYPSPGTVYAGEGFTRFNETTGSYTYIEYSTSSGTKRGYAPTSQLAGRNRGVLADVTAASATVFTGPRNNYVTGGSVYLGEYVVILEKDPASASPAWYYIEFNSTSGRKRGYVDQSMITPYSSVSGLGSLKTVQGAASALQSLNVYAGPNSNFASIGSVSSNEAVFTIEGASMESSYSYIEYTTASGRKRGYVIASGLQALPGVFATMANAATVYNGPSAGIYASAGSVDLGEAVQVLGKEKSWFYIQYATSSNLTLNAGQTQQFTATVSPANATNKTVAWSSSNSSIATVDANGLATAGIAGGTASITATTVDGSFTATASLSAAPVGLSFSYPNNAQVRGDFLYVRDADGNILENQIVADGDIITVLDVGYTKQLAFVEYPTPSGVSSGYVTNATNIIKYYHLYEWKNSSTTEIVYDENGNQIGSISPRETATVLFQRADGMYAIVYDTDKGANTKSGFVSYSGSSDSDKPTQSTFSYPNNAKIEGDSLYVRDVDGNILIGQMINDGTQITVLNVGYANQLALVEYPADSGVLSGYIANATDLIKYFNPDEWRNGSTIELVYDANGNQIGSLSPYETATPLFRKDGMTHVVYNTDKGTNTKSGLVRYSGDGVYNDRGKTSPPEATGTPGNMIVSDEAVSFIATYEGFSATPYRGKDYQNLTIGYGHVILSGESFTSLTQSQALALLKSDLAGYERSVNNEFGTILNQNQFDALVSFCYNTGKNVWGKANLTNHVKAGASADTLRTDFTNWSYCNGERLPGLVNRRMDEWEMFVYADYVRTHQ